MHGGGLHDVDLHPVAASAATETTAKEARADRFIGWIPLVSSD